MVLANEKKLKAESAMSLKSIKFMSSDFKSKLKVDYWKMKNFIRVLRYLQVLMEIQQRFKNRVLHIQNLELEIRQARFEEEVF